MFIGEVILAGIVYCAIVLFIGKCMAIGNQEGPRLDAWR